MVVIKDERFYGWIWKMPSYNQWAPENEERTRRLYRLLETGNACGTCGAPGRNICSKDGCGMYLCNLCALEGGTCYVHEDDSTHRCMTCGMSGKIKKCTQCCDGYFCHPRLYKYCHLKATGHNSICSKNYQSFLNGYWGELYHLLEFIRKKEGYLTWLKNTHLTEKVMLHDVAISIRDFPRRSRNDDDDEGLEEYNIDNLMEA